MALTTSKDFRIAPCIAEISGCWKCPLGLNHPVCCPATDNKQVINACVIQNQFRFICRAGPLVRLCSFPTSDTRDGIMRLWNFAAKKGLQVSSWNAFLRVSDQWTTKAMQFVLPPFSFQQPKAIGFYWMNEGFASEYRGALFRVKPSSPSLRHG